MSECLSMVIFISLIYSECKKYSYTLHLYMFKNQLLRVCKTITRERLVYERNLLENPPEKSEICMGIQR